ncbi:Uma2 family endonuclease [Cystobacter fuscus]|uniref:Uma2 family endonuclease n=1 Tax=Cystobacter fuscus TaxID=43 RepID=UPI002B310D78|nr:Uma2 family endonuclease [Cystobacter fuscus]
MSPERPLHLGAMEDPRSRREALYAALEELPPNVMGEIIGGELFVCPRPASPHARAASLLGGELVGPFDRGRGGPGGWVLLDAPELHLGQDVVVPDLTGWRRKRMPEMPHVAAFTLVPDWVCEVLSPSTAALDRARKMTVYAREGVGHLWLVDPVLQTLEVYRRELGGWFVLGTHVGEARVRAEPFEALELELSALWAR